MRCTSCSGTKTWQENRFTGKAPRLYKGPNSETHRSSLFGGMQRRYHMTTLTGIDVRSLEIVNTKKVKLLLKTKSEQSPAGRESTQSGHTG
jgi:hypothetical protein